MILDIDIVKHINPQQKDLDRVDDYGQYMKGNQNWFYGSGAPISGNASKQAKLIKDPVKLIRRAKAVILRWGTRDYSGYVDGNRIIENVWKPFDIALRQAGLSSEMIQEIKDYTR